MQKVLEVQLNIPQIPASLLSRRRHANDMSANHESSRRSLHRAFMTGIAQKLMSCTRPTLTPRYTLHDAPSNPSCCLRQHTRHIVSRPSPSHSECKSTPPQHHNTTPLYAFNTAQTPHTLHRLSVLASNCGYCSAGRCTGRHDSSMPRAIRANSPLGEHDLSLALRQDGGEVEARR